MIKVDGSILYIEYYGYFNMYNVSHISELKETTDGPNPRVPHRKLYFTIDNIQIYKYLRSDDDKDELEFNHLYNEIIKTFYEINKIEKPLK